MDEETLRVLINSILEEIRNEIAGDVKELERLIRQYQLAVIEEEAARLVSRNSDLELLDVRVLSHEIHQVQKQIAGKRKKLENLSQLRTEAMEKRGYREELVERLNAFSDS